MAGCSRNAASACATAPDDAKAARLEERSDGWVLNVFDAELHHPVALTCTLARSLARLFLAETESPSAPVEAPYDVSVDLACVALGLWLLRRHGPHGCQKQIVAVTSSGLRSPRSWSLAMTRLSPAARSCPVTCLPDFRLPG